MDNYDTTVATIDSHPAGHCSFASTHGVQPYTVYNGEMVWPDHCVVGTHGWELHKDLRPIKEVYEKGGGNSPGYSIGENADFMSFIKNFEQVDLCGLAFDYCVKECAKAIKGGTHARVRVLKQLCRSVAPSDEDKVTSELRALGIEVL